MQRGVFDKKGVSAVVATVLIIMITVAAVGVVWAVVIPMIKDSMGGSVVCNDVDISIGTTQGYTCYDSVQKVVAVQVVKGANNLVVSGLKFTVSSGGNSVSYSTDFSFVKSASKVFYINVSKLNSVEEIGLIPVLVDGKSSKECTKVGLNIIPSCSLGEVEVINCESSCICARTTPVGQNCSDGCGGNCTGAKMSGAGTSEDPYQISSWTHLNEVRNDLDAYYILMNDLASADSDYSGIGNNWVPIGDDNNYPNNVFSGSFNGNGHIIGDLIINLPSNMYAGLFGYLSGSISNLGLINSNITGGWYAGSIIGFNDYGSITNSYATGNVTATGSWGGGYAGGILGILQGATITNSYFMGNVSGSYASGGIVGVVSVGSITNSYFVGIVSGGYAGGITGDQGNGGSVSDSFWDKEISGVNVMCGYGGRNEGCNDNKRKTTEQMKKLFTFNSEGGNWDISGGQTDLNNGYPYLSGTSSPVWYIADNTDVALADGASCTSSEECLSGVCGAKNYLVDFLHSPGNICRPTGDLPIGSSCSADNGWDGRNCESGYCDQGNACSTGEIGTSCYVGYRSCVSGFCVNGVCSATPGQIGQGCGQERGDCESTYCSGSVCTDGGIGAECYSIDSCQSGYYCSNGGNGASGICTDGSTGSPCNDMGYDPMCLSGSCVNNICE